MKKRLLVRVIWPSTLIVFGMIGILTFSETSQSATISKCEPDLTYCPSDIQERVDRSFSGIGINSKISMVAGQLNEISGICFPGECDWRDGDGVRHYFFGDDMVVKSVKADEFVDRPIGALGIGMARSRTNVIANARRFLSGVELDCKPAPSTAGCHATLDPGWIWISFDSEGQLVEVHFDGYHFT